MPEACRFSDAPLLVPIGMVKFIVIDFEKGSCHGDVQQKLGNWTLATLPLSGKKTSYPFKFENRYWNGWKAVSNPHASLRQFKSKARASWDPQTAFSLNCNKDEHRSCNVITVGWRSLKITKLTFDDRSEHVLMKLVGPHNRKHVLLTFARGATWSS